MSSSTTSHVRSVPSKAATEPGTLQGDGAVHNAVHSAAQNTVLNAVHNAVCSAQCSVQCTMQCVVHNACKHSACGHHVVDAIVLVHAQPNLRPLARKSARAQVGTHKLREVAAGECRFRQLLQTVYLRDEGVRTGGYRLRKRAGEVDRTGGLQRWAAEAGIGGGVGLGHRSEVGSGTLHDESVLAQRRVERIHQLRLAEEHAIDRNNAVAHAQQPTCGSWPVSRHALDPVGCVGDLDANPSIGVLGYHDQQSELARFRYEVVRQLHGAHFRVLEGDPFSRVDTVQWACSELLGQPRLRSALGRVSPPVRAAAAPPAARPLRHWLLAARPGAALLIARRA